MMALAEVTAQDADTKAPPSLQLFVRCGRRPPQEPSGADVLTVELVDALDVWQASISPAQKPRALDCSPSAYLTAVEAAFSPPSASQQPRFQLKWSRKKRVMTLMESATAAGFAMKYTAITFSALPGSTDQEKATTAGYLGNLLHDVVERDARTRDASVKQEEKLRELEKLLKEKDAVLERALGAKQAVEDQLFEGFCAVLNAKKDEIQRLQKELMLAEARGVDTNSNGGKKATAKRKKPAAKRPRKATGAKFKREAEEEEVEMSDGSDREHSDEEGSSDGGDDRGAKSGKRQKRVKRDAIEAYSQLPVDLRRGALRISSAEDVLSDLDAIMTSEVEADDAALRAEAGGSRKRGRKASPWMRARVESAPPSQADASEGEAGPSAIQDKDSAKKPRVPARQVSPVKAAESEDEDILDMLS
ncbi:hypothetical protein BBJ28_00025648 [Nothophytophthora sp. Chile5]|nr:hypothetical protein BBJ28_00025648 [Nothophytophthora sp. Chile5]